MCSLFQGGFVHPAFFRCSGEGVLSIVRLKVLARHSSIDPRFAQSNKCVRVTLCARTLYTLAKISRLWNERTRSLVKQVHVKRAHNKIYTRALAILRAHARVLAHCTHAEYTVRVLAHYALRSRARNLATVHRAREWQQASTRELLCNAHARAFKTHYTTKLHSTIIRAWPSRITLKLH